jgi:hypothetical protein
MHNRIALFTSSIQQLQQHHINVRLISICSANATRPCTQAPHTSLQKTQPQPQQPDVILTFKLSDEGSENAACRMTVIFISQSQAVRAACAALVCHIRTLHCAMCCDKRSPIFVQLTAVARRHFTNLQTFLSGSQQLGMQSTTADTTNTPAKATNERQHNPR